MFIVGDFIEIHNGPFAGRWCIRSIEEGSSWSAASRDRSDIWAAKHYLARIQRKEVSDSHWEASGEFKDVELRHDREGGLSVRIQPGPNHLPPDTTTYIDF